jgi:flagella basal body P-ring formation protein FlgA
MMRLRRAGAALFALVAVAVPACVLARTLVPPVQIVPAASIAAVADRAARSAVSDPQRALAAAFAVSDQQLPTGDLGIAAGAAQVNATYVSIPIALSIDGHVVRTIYAGYRITSFVRTTIAAHDIAPDAVLRAADMTQATVPFTGRPALEPTTFIGRKARATIARGTVLTPELTLVNEIVRAGMPAVLIVHDGPISLAADVVARTSGGLGDSVTIFNPQTQKALSGIVTGPNTVELTLPGATE